MHKKIFVRFTAAASAALLALSMVFGLKASAVTFTPNFVVESDAAYLVNLDKDMVLYEKNADKRCYPASLTKIMTAILVLENIRQADSSEQLCSLSKIFSDFGIFFVKCSL